MEIVKERAQVTKEIEEEEKKKIFRTKSPSTTTVNQTGPNVPPLYFVPMQTHTHTPSVHLFLFYYFFVWPIIARFANGFS